MQALSTGTADTQEVRIIIKRNSENSRHTYGSFLLEIGGGAKSVSGYTLEPGGLSGPSHLSGTLLPAGTYRLEWQPVAGEGNRLVLFNEYLPRQQQFQLNKVSDIGAGQPYLVLSLTPVYGAGEYLQHNARVAGFELESTLRKADLRDVVLRIDDI